MEEVAAGQAEEVVVYRPFSSPEELRALEVHLRDEVRALEAAEADLDALLCDPRLEKRLRRTIGQAGADHDGTPRAFPPAGPRRGFLRPSRVEVARYDAVVSDIERLAIPRNASDTAWLHGRLTGTGRASFRDGRAQVRGASRTLDAPEPAQVAAELDRVLEWAQGDEGHPAIRAALLAGEILGIRPFKQGDPLLARLLMRLMLQRNGMARLGDLVLERRVEVAAPEALDRLIESVTGHTGEPWVRAAIGGLRQGVEATLEEARFARRYLDLLNERQWRVADWFRHAHKRTPDATWRFREIHTAFPSIPPRTLKRDLATLREVGLLEMHGKLKSARYVFTGEPPGPERQDSTT